MQVREWVQTVREPIQDFPVVQMSQARLGRFGPGPGCGDGGPVATTQRIRRDGLRPVVLRLSCAVGTKTRSDLRFRLLDVVHDYRTEGSPRGVLSSEQS